jgi:hypothetical protein
MPKNEPNQQGDHVDALVKRVSGWVSGFVNSLLSYFAPGIGTNEGHTAADYYIFFQDIGDPNRVPGGDDGKIDLVIADDRDSGVFGYVGKLTDGQAQIAKKRLEREFENTLEKAAQKSGIHSAADSEASASPTEHVPCIGLLSLSEIMDIWEHAGQPSQKDQPKCVESFLQSFIDTHQLTPDQQQILDGCADTVNRIRKKVGREDRDIENKHSPEDLPVVPAEQSVADHAHYPYQIQAMSGRGIPPTTVDPFQGFIEPADEPADVNIKNPKEINSPIVKAIEKLIKETQRQTAAIEILGEYKSNDTAHVVEAINRVNERFDKPIIIEFPPDESKSLKPEDCPVEGNGGHWEPQKVYADRVGLKESTLVQYRQTMNGVRLSIDGLWGIDKAGHTFKRLGDKSNSPYQYFVRFDSSR